jgi:hypothetical protein
LLTPITLAAVVLTSGVRRFPFADERTSTFWLVMVAVLMATGVLTVARALYRLRKPAGLVVVLAALGVWLSVTAAGVRAHPLGDEDTRSQVAYLDAHMRAGDVVVLSSAASWGFAYYERRVAPVFTPISYAANGFLPEYPSVAWLVQMTNRDPSDVDRALAAARQLLSGEPRRPKGRIWLVRSHVAPAEGAEWTRDLSGAHIETIRVGPEPLLLYLP